VNLKQCIINDHISLQIMKTVCDIIYANKCNMTYSCLHYMTGWSNVLIWSSIRECSWINGTRFYFTCCKLATSQQQHNKEKYQTEYIAMIYDMYNESLFSYLCMPTTWHCPHLPTTAAATDHISCLWARDGTNRQTDTVPIHRPCYAYYGDTGNKQSLFTSVFYNKSQIWLIG